MVAFNPELPPSPAENFTGYQWQGRPIQAPTPDESGKTRGKALGDAVLGLANTVDTFTKQNIDAKINAGIDKEQDDFIKGLNAVKNAQGIMTPEQGGQADRLGLNANVSDAGVVAPNRAVGGTAAAPAPGTNSTPAGDTPPQLIPSSTASQDPPPAALERGLQMAQNLQQAQAVGAGKVTETYYNGRLLELTKSLRSQYPGYRDHIDQKLGNSANNYMRNLMEEINANAANKNKAFDHMHNQVIDSVHKAMDEGDPIAKGMWSALQSQQGMLGVHDNAIMETIRASRDTQYKWSQATKEQAGSEANSKLFADKAKPPLVNFINDSFATKLKAAYSAYGVMSDEQVRDAMHEAAANPGKYTGEFWTNQAALRQKAIDETKAWLTSQMNKPFMQLNPDGSQSNLPLFPDRRGPSTVYTAAELQNYIDQGAKPYAANVAMMGKGDVTMAQLGQETLQAQKGDFAIRFHNDPFWGKASDFIENFNKMNPDPAFKAELWRKIQLGSGNDDRVNSLYNTWILGSTTGAKGPDGHYVTPSDWADTHKATLGINPDGRQVSRMLNSVSTITQSKVSDQSKAAFFNSWFDPKNNILDDKYLSKDFKDQSGRWVPGRVYAYNKILSPESLAEAKRLSDNGTDPALWQKTGDWMMNSFRQIYSKEVQDLKDMDATPWLKVNYNSDTHKFGITDLNGQPVNRQYKPLMQQSLARLNSAIDVLGNFSKLDNRLDVNAALLQQFTHTGTEPGSKKLLDSLINAGKMQKTEGEGSTKANFASEDNPATASTGQAAISKALGKNASLSLEDVADKSARLEHLDPTFRKGMEAAVNDYRTQTGKTPHISSLYRDMAQQAAAYARFLGGSGGLAAPPGKSQHQFGRAADLNSDPHFGDWLKKQELDKYGLEFLPGRAGVVDPYHVQLAKSLRQASQ